MKDLTIMTNIKFELSVLVMLSILHSGCARGPVKITDPASPYSAEPNDNDLYEAKHKMEYFSLIKTQIEREAKEGDIRTAHELLMTDRYKQDFIHYRRLTPNEHFTNRLIDFTTFSGVAVNIIPSIGSTNLMNLLVQYCYGTQYYEDSELSDVVVKSIIAQLLIGAYSAPDQRLGMDKVIIESIKPKDAKGNSLLVRIRFILENKPVLCIFDFQKYEVNGKKVWLPRDWGWGGYVERIPR